MDDRARASAEGWVSGSCAYDRSMERRDAWLEDHPDWTIRFISDLGVYEASVGSYATTLTVLHDKTLGPLMDRVEAEFGNQPIEEPEPATHD